MNIDAAVLMKPGSYHRLNQSHADLLMLYIGVVQADGDLHLVEYGEGVLLHLQSGTLDVQNRREVFHHEFKRLQCGTGETRPVLYLFVKNEVCTSFILLVEEDCPFKAELWDEHDDRVLPHKQDISFFIQDASALEEQLERERKHLLRHSEQCTVNAKPFHFFFF